MIHPNRVTPTSQFHVTGVQPATPLSVRLDDWLALTEHDGRAYYLITEFWPEWGRPFAEKAVAERARRTPINQWLEVQS